MLTNMQQMPPQFILWKSVPQMPPKKALKVPCDVMGGNTDHLNPMGWMDYATAVETAQTTGFNVGFVFTANDPYFLLDLDGCRDATTGAVEPWARDVLAMFPDAFMEVSVSGTGFHVIGGCNGHEFENRRNKFADGKMEFYHKERFVAIGTQQQGTLNLNWTKTLLKLVPERAVVNKTVVMGNGPVEGYTGPEDDDELIHLMLNSRGSAAVAFGDKASVRDLWEGNAEQLGKFFPSQSGEPFDHSSADAALMNHLAYWTGKDYPRMVRMFGCSVLGQRDKWNRDDYQLSTTTNSIAVTNAVYDVPVKTQEKKKEADERQVAAIACGSLLTGQQQEEYFHGCIYVASLNRVMLQNGTYLGREAFNASYGGKTFLMRHDGTKPTDNAWEAFTQSQLVDFPKAEDTIFDPALDYQEIRIRNGLRCVNTFKPPVINSTPNSDVSIWNEFLRKLITDDSDREILNNYLAALTQAPSTKIRHGICLIGGMGCGKSTVLHMGAYLTTGSKDGEVPSPYFKSVAADKLSGTFNSRLSECLMLQCHEYYGNTSQRDRQGRDAVLKALVTENILEVEPKGKEARAQVNHTNIMLAANDIDALGNLHKGNRRWSVFVIPYENREDLEAVGLDSGFFTRLYDFLNNGGYEAVHGYYAAYEIDQAMHPHNLGQAPITSTIQEVFEYSQSPIERLFVEATEDERDGFKGGWISSHHAKALLAEGGFDVNRTMPRLGAILKPLGYRRRPRRHEIDMGGFVGKRRVTLYAHKDHFKEMTKDDVTEYLRNNPVVSSQVGLGA